MLHHCQNLICFCFFSLHIAKYTIADAYHHDSYDNDDDDDDGDDDDADDDGDVDDND